MNWQYALLVQCPGLILAHASHESHVQLTRCGLRPGVPHVESQVCGPALIPQIHLVVIIDVSLHIPVLHPHMSPITPVKRFFSTPVQQAAHPVERRLLHILSNIDFTATSQMDSYDCILGLIGVIDLVIQAWDSEGG